MMTMTPHKHIYNSGHLIELMQVTLKCCSFASIGNSKSYSFRPASGAASMMPGTILDQELPQMPVEN